MKQNQIPLPVECDVLIIGCGPVGAALASLLGRHGINTLVLDKSPSILMMPRAIALDNEALRALQMVGLDENAFARMPIPEVRMHSPIMSTFATANTRGSQDGHPKLVTFYQPELEEALAANLQKLTMVQVARNSELLEFEDKVEYVVAKVRDQDGVTHNINCRYLVGADGASSLVRTLLGEDFDGKTYSEDWLIVDAGEREAEAMNHVEFICDPKRAVPHMPAPGGRERWEFMLRRDETREQMEHPEKIAELMAPWARGRELKVERTAVYRFHARCCRNFSKGRVFLVGDAAHITPPFVGQGLVAGLRDVVNLGWKLAWVLKGQASPVVLHSYDMERRPHALKMINLARRMGHLIMTRHTLSSLLVHGSMRILRSFPPLRRYLEELKIKPANRYSRGLFSPYLREAGLVPGCQFPQAWVRGQAGLCLSDDALGQHLLLLGIGCDPAHGLTSEQLKDWQAAGGRFVHIGMQGQKSSGSELLEDLCGGLTRGLPTGSIVAVRPDLFIMAAAGPGEARQVVRAALLLLKTGFDTQY